MIPHDFCTFNLVQISMTFQLISGYFTPSSCDRKGRHQFMTDKLKRLGIPFVLYTLLFGPALDLLIHSVFIGHDSKFNYYPDCGPCWFLAWLLMFNAGYVILDDTVSVLTVKFPSLIRLVLIGAGLGVVQLALIPLLGGSYLFMPISVGSLPFDILFFVSGVMAKRNDWFPAIRSLNVVAVRCMFVSGCLLLIALFAYCYTIDYGNGGTFSAVDSVRNVIIFRHD